MTLLLQDLLNSGMSREEINALLSRGNVTSPGFDQSQMQQQMLQTQDDRPRLNSLMNISTGRDVPITDIYGQPSRSVPMPATNMGSVPVETPYGKGRYMAGDNTRVVLNDGRIVDLGRDTGRERAIEKENLGLQKQRAELAQLQAKPLSEYDKTMQQERAKRDIFASMPPSMREAEEVKRLGIKLKPGERYNMEKSEIELIPGSAPYNKQAGEVREESIGLKGLNRVIGNMLDRVDAVEKAPGLSSAVGFWDAATPALASGWNAEDKATARSYITNLQEYLETKGLADLRASGVAPGSITEKEWSKFRTMVGNIDPTMDEKSFQKELNNLKQYAANARAEAAAKEAALKKQYGPMWEKYAVSSGQPSDSAPQSAVQGGAVRVGSVNEAMKLKSGTRFIDPNGVERVRP